ncbi:MAG: 50S ribosomal protein L11 [Thermoplasmata archaeon]
MPDTVEVLVEGGKATPGPPLGPALGPLGVNIVKVVAEINAKTKQFDGMRVPVKIIVDAKTKSFQVEVGTPPVSALILKEVKAEKGSGSPKTNKIGNITIKQAKRIAEMKMSSLLSKDMKNAVKEVVGTCQSMGVTVEGKEPKEVIAEIDAGKWDKEITG